MNNTFVSIVSNAFGTTTTNYSLEQILSNIKNGVWQDKINQVRQVHAKYGKDGTNKIKLGLPAVLFSGTFLKRKANQIQQHSGILCIDLDNLNDSLETVRSQIVNDLYTMACFVSPSGMGLKILVKISNKVEEHLKYFLIVEKYYKEKFNITIDKACKDVSRLCFVSFDPTIFVNYNSAMFKGE
jgi:hypothetical protein